MSELKNGGCSRGSDRVSTQTRSVIVDPILRLVNPILICTLAFSHKIEHFFHYSIKVKQLLLFTTSSWVYFSYCLSTLFFWYFAGNRCRRRQVMIRLPIELGCHLPFKCVRLTRLKAAKVISLFYKTWLLWMILIREKVYLSSKIREAHKNFIVTFSLFLARTHTRTHAHAHTCVIKMRQQSTAHFV